MLVILLGLLLGVTGVTVHADSQVEPIRVTAAGASDALRTAVTQHIWSGGLPSRLPDDVILNVQAPAYTPLNNLLRIDRLTIRQPSGIDSYPLVFWPRSFNGRAFIYHGGHEALERSPRNIANVHYLVTVGYVVLVMDMPMYGANPNPGLIYHGGIFAIDTPNRHALAWFLEPVVVGVNYLRSVMPGVPVAMTGYSGGGWTTAWAAAIDRRIGHSYPVAGSLPLPIRTPPECGDEEQFDADIFGSTACDRSVEPGWLNYSELYVLGGQDRAAIQINNRYDGCCFWGDRRPQFVPYVQQAMVGIGGSFESHVDATTTLHEISPSALEAMVRHDQGQPFAITGAVIPPPATPVPPTATPVPTPDLSSYWTPTPITYDPSSCSPRPPVRLASTLTPGGLVVTVTSYTPITALVFAPGRNATPGPVGGIGSTVATFVLGRSGPGAFSVPFTVTDGCGPWQTLVGHGGN